MKTLKPGESTTIRLRIDGSRSECNYDLVIKYELPDSDSPGQKKTHTILLDLVEEPK